METFYINTCGFLRKPTRVVSVGNCPLGGDNHIRLQSMTTTNTNDIEATVEQSRRIIEAGAHYVRITAQGVKEAKSLSLVKQELRRLGFETPLIADIHFNPSAALEAANYVEKIRINPGNYSDKRNLTDRFEYTNAEYTADLEKVEERILPLLEICKKNNVAIRIGVNHGSLSDRIMSRYGDTPLGMALSAMEFLQICAKHNFHNIVVSMKSSNTRVMVQATRTLVMLMEREGMSYPLHLGVTEAGEGEDGRIKSAVGIATLLADGIGDTIRVSLTEEPELEIPVALQLAKHFEEYTCNESKTNKSKIGIDPTNFSKRETRSVLNVGGDNHPVVLADLSKEGNLSMDSLNSWGWNFDSISGWKHDDNAADFIFIGEQNIDGINSAEELPLIGTHPKCKHQLKSIEQLENTLAGQEGFVIIDSENFSHKQIEVLASYPSFIPIITGVANKSFYKARNVLGEIISKEIQAPVILNFSYAEKENFNINAASDFGPFFVDGLCNGIMVSASSVDDESVKNVAFGILQASRERFSKTEFISCPGCGRTLFNLNETLRKVKSQTAHLKGLKIGVMGCIVNGPGEMADADYGYVGAGPGRVTLYKGKEVMKKNIPEEQAVDFLVELIKEHGDWVDV